MMLETATFTDLIASRDAAVTGVGFSPLVVHPGRLGILLALSREPTGTADFTDVRCKTGLTDGNLASHARRLRDGGLLTVIKQFRGAKPATIYRLTPEGSAALADHVHLLTAATTGQTSSPASPSAEPIRHPLGKAHYKIVLSPSVATAPVASHPPEPSEPDAQGDSDAADLEEDDWID